MPLISRNRVRFEQDVHPGLDRQRWRLRAGRADTETSVGVGDLLMRAKYVVTRGTPVDLAGGFTLSVPTGNREDFQGTGDTLVGVAMYASRTYAERLEPHLNAAFVLDADKFARSQVRYSAGPDVRVFDWLTLNNDFLGRSDIEQPDTIERPVFLQIERTMSCSSRLGSNSPRSKVSRRAAAAYAKRSSSTRCYR